MGQALYRKHRPKKLAETVGQDHITQTLQNALKNGKISHAYLFTGPRGVGKTTVARILAHEVNNLPYNETGNELDIIEIDAASNRRIDEIRDLRDKVHIAPSSAKYKVYIIDEVHMLTKEAFNALLKTLEEPPAHVIFILATTESHKLPETIISRTQRFTFKPIDKAILIEQLKDIAQQEKIKIDDEALELIAEHGEGSFRDSLSLLDQLGSGGKKVDLKEVQRALGIAPVTALEALIKALGGNEPQTLLQQLTDLYEQGYQAAQLARQLGQVLRTDLITGRRGLSSLQSTELLKQLLDVPASGQPARLLEIILLAQVLQNKPVDQPTFNQPIESPVKVSTSPPTIKPSKRAHAEFSLDAWPEILDSVKGNHNTLYSLLRMAIPSYEQGTLTLSFQFGFHQRQASNDKNRQLLQDIISQHTGLPAEIVSIIEPSVETPASDTRPAKSKSEINSDPNLTTINNIFGSSELLES